MCFYMLYDNHFNFPTSSTRKKTFYIPLPFILLFLVHFFEPMKAYTHTSNCNYCIHRNRQQNRFVAIPVVCIPFFSSINNVDKKIPADGTLRYPLPKKYCKLNIHIHCHSCFLYHHPPCSHPPRH